MHTQQVQSIYIICAVDEKPSVNPRDSVDELEARVNRLAQSSSRPTLPDTEEDVLPINKSFSEANDSELARALTSRIQAISTAETEPEEQQDESEVPPLTGQEIRQLLFTKCEDVIQH